MERVVPQIDSGSRFWKAGALGMVLAAALATGCKSHTPATRTDQQITTDVQAKIGAESALAGQNIQVTVANGVATLSGTVSDEASRALAGNDSGTVDGVRTVVNNLSVTPAQQAAAPPASAQELPAPTPQPSARDRRQERQQAREERRHRSDRAPEDQPAAAPPVQSAENAAPAPVQAPPPPPAHPKPVVKEVTLPAGTVVPVRLTETLDSKTAQSNDVFHGSVAGDLGTQGVIAVPRGTPVMGRIVDAREAAHFKGAALLSIELTQLNTRGKSVSLVTDTFTKEGEGRGKNTATKTGGGAALGAIIGGLAGGGKGAVIGGLAGGAAGTGVNAATRGQQAVIPTETLVNFRLQSPVTLTVTLNAPGDQEDEEPKDPQLQHRP